MNNYEINEETMAVISTAKGKTKIIEEHHEYQINCDAYEVMDESCKYFGSSYTGRVSGAKKMLGYEYKVPIIVEESKQLIFFPTISPQAEGCCWISLKHFQSLQETAGKTQRAAVHLHRFGTDFVRFRFAPCVQYSKKLLLSQKRKSRCGASAAASQVVRIYASGVSSTRVTAIERSSSCLSSTISGQFIIRSDAF